MQTSDTLILLAPAWPADENDSVWIPAKQLFVKQLRQLYPDLQVIILAYNYPHHTQTYQWHGATVIPFDGMETRKLQRYALWFKVWRQLQQLRRQHHIIGMFSFWCGETALVGHYFGQLHRIKHFCWVSGQDAKKDNRLVRFIRPKPAELVTISRFLTDEFEKNHGIRPSHTIPIGIEPGYFNAGNVARDITILGAGSLIPLKQYAIFIYVIKLLIPHISDLKAVICGGGPEYDKLNDLILELGLEKHVTLTGIKSHEEVLAMMQRASIFLHPSSYEGFGAVCLEALYAGNEVISFVNPMYLNIPKWHIVQTTSEMYECALQLLQREPDYSPVMLYEMTDSVKQIMALFS